MSDGQQSCGLAWEEVEACHLRAKTDKGFDYDIIATPDGQVSWQGIEFGRWIYENDIDAAKLAAQAEFDDYRGRRTKPL